MHLILIAGIASVGLAAAYYSSGAQTAFTQPVDQFTTVDWRSVFVCCNSPPSLCCSHRQHLMEAVLRGRLSVRSHAEHGGMGGGRVWQNQKPDWAEELQSVYFSPDLMEERARKRSVSPQIGFTQCSCLCRFVFLISNLPFSRSVVLDLTQLCDICVQEERVRYLGKGYLLMLRLAAGFSYPLTQSATLGGRK